MARLNEPLPDPSALDALKRRFTRQNRDLARTNSAQSLRIRNLETEISRLLSENIALREAAIASQKEAERWRTQCGLGGEVLAMKERLERKLGEVGLLVEELGALPEKANRRKSRDKRRDSLLPKAIVRSPDQKDWRNRQTLSGVLGAVGLEQEGRLPPIVEDKLYPRRTLEPLEIQGLRGDPLQNDSESPEIGPPPVSNYDAVGRGSWGNMEESPQSQEATLLEPDMVQLPSNLETRRKRRTSSLLSDMTPSESESDVQESRPALFKSGAKRKLDVSELEEPQHVAKENDDFVFQRRLALQPSTSRKSGRFSRSNGQQHGEIIIPTTVPLNSVTKEQPLERKVLAPRSTNSPSKRQASMDEKSLKPDIMDLDKGLVSVVRNISGITQPSKPRRQQQPAVPSEMKEKPPLIDIESGNDLPPKTPAALDDVLSPMPTEPSTKNESKRAPQEAAIINSVEDVLNGSIGRASRRAKAAVSYAEPNLRDKMRRPGRELVSAIEGIDKKNKEASVNEDFRRSQSELGNAEPCVKIEDGAEVIGVAGREKWKKLPMAQVRVKKEEPVSPLSDKKNAGEHDTRDKNQERKRSVVDGTSVERLEKEVGRLSIFDPPSSSPAEMQRNSESQASTTTTGNKRQQQSTTFSTSRRHSMVPSNLPANSIVLGAKSTNAPSMPRSGSAASNRSDGMDIKRHGVELKKSTSVAAMKHAGVENGDDRAKARAERIASRRRSMML